jgi:hypothetical protein
LDLVSAWFSGTNRTSNQNRSFWIYKHTVFIKEKIMKASILFTTGLILAAGAVVGSINVAHAGVAGSAGSISAQFTATGNNLVSTAGAVAAGKTGAFTTASGTTTDISAVAAGYSGVLTVTGFSTSTVGYSAADDTLKSITQANNFDGAAPKTSVNLVPATVGVSLN